MERLYFHRQSHDARVRRVTPARGFTLIEMLVVLAIIGVISTLVITTRSSFDNSIILANTAYDIALTIRDTENYGFGSQEINGFMNVGYGVHFAKATPSSFIVFADTYPGPTTNVRACHVSRDIAAPDAKAGNCVYNPPQFVGDPNNDVNVQTYALGNGATISDICVNTSGTNWSCANSGNKQLTSLDITFIRPNANMTITENGSYTAGVAQACLAISSGVGSGLRYVALNQSGLVSASATACPLQ